MKLSEAIEVMKSKKMSEHIIYGHGDAIDIKWRKEDHRFICCKCGFVHRLRFSVAGDKLRMRVWDDKRWTEEQDDEDATN